VTARRLDCSPAEYLSDPAPEPSLSSSIAKVLCEQSPAHARLVHPRLGGKPSESTPATDHGTLIHRLLLGKGATIVSVDAADYRTKKARETRDEARSQGHVPVLSVVYSEALVAAQAIKEAIGRSGVALDGDSEVPLLWQEWAPHGEIYARAMLDHVTDRNGRLHIYDVKTCESAHPDACLRSAVRYGYDIQAHAYTRAAELAWPDYAGRVTFTFLFCETEPPYAVLPATLDGIMRERGRRRWQYAVETWSCCLHTDTWPGYATEPVTLYSPDWLLRQEEMQR
jgi:hypothetical protein